MKKTLLIILVFITSIVNAQKNQKWGSFAQFGGGVSFSIRGAKYSPLLQGEYGKTFKKWLDLSATMTYETETYRNSYNVLSDFFFIPDEDRLAIRIPNDWVSICTSVSLALNVRVDMVKLFVADSRHSVKIGGGVGLSFEHSSFSYKDYLNSGESYYFCITNEIRCIGTLRASYEFDITPKFTMGAFFYFGALAPSAGLSFRHNF